MSTAWQLVTGPVLWPLSLEEAKRQSRIDVDDEDADTDRRIRSATRQAEPYLGRGLLTQTWRLTRDAFADTMLLPMAAPLQSVTSVKYYDTSGVQQTLATTYYQMDADSEPGRIYLKPNQVWPQLQSGRRMAVEVVYVVGWTDPALIPESIVDAVALLCADRHVFRENSTAGAVTELPNAAEALLAPHRVFWYEATC